MADINYNDIPNIETDWQGYSGQSVQKFIKAQLSSKMGFFYYDATSNRYLVFASEEKKNEYVADPTLTNLVLGTFDAPFNYSAEINLSSPSYNAVFLGSTGNYIDFTFDIKNKQGASTGENVTITYTFIRNAVRQTVTETRKFGDIVHFNIDKYLGEGTNVVMVSIVGQTTLAATSISVTYQVVNLTIKDELDISNVYDLRQGSVVMEVPFTVSGYGTKIVEWYIDGELLDYVKNEDEVVDVTISRIKYITLSNLQQGKHSLQIRAYTTINGEKFYTDTLYRDILVYTGADNKLIVGIATSIPAQYGIIGATDNVTLYGVIQYIPYALRFATYSPLNTQGSQITIKLDGETKGVVASSNGIENEFTFMATVSGNKTLQLISDDVTYTIPVDVAPTTMDIEEITADLVMKFDAIGKNNLSLDREQWTDGTYTGTLEGFNFNNTSGWVNGRLEMNAGSSFAIDLAPLAGNPTNTGKTIEIEWSTKNVSNDDAVICDLRGDNGAGLLITATKVSLISASGVVVETEYKSDENVRVSFVINRASGVSEQRLSYIYTNGIVSRSEAWSVTDNYTSNKEIRFTATTEAEVSLKSIMVYNTALTADNILNNFTLYRDTVAEMMAVYDRNAVYEEGTKVFSTEKMSGRLPVMVVTGDIPILENTSDKDTQIVVDIDYINMQNPDRSFRMTGAAMRPQGTSSMGYPKKNFRIYTTKLDGTMVYDADGNVIEDKLYAFKKGSQPVDCWCLKADYAESSGTHNTGIARLWNAALYNAQIDGEYKLRTEAQKAAIAAGYPYDVRTTIDGFPILLFYRQSENDDLIFIGKYNFNNDKSTESVFGFTGIPGFNNERMQCWEVLNNGNALALFTTTDGFDENWSEAFESRYPDTKTPNTADLKAFAEWMSNVSQEDFKAQKWEHFNIYMMAAYWIYLNRHAGADQFVKNAMFTSEDGQHFYYILYDNDTINGLINTGRLLVPPTATRQTKDASSEYYFAGHDSRLWNMLEADDEFMQIVSAVDNALYSAGISYLNTIKIFDEEQADKWVERVYNQDAQYKYIGPYVEKGINNLFMLQGKRDLHRKWWLAKRFAIYDAKYVSGTYKSQAIELKCINSTPAGQQFTVTAGYPIDYGYGINNVPRSFGIALEIGESHTFTTEEVVNLGDPIRIYGATNISGLDLSAMASRLAVVTISNVYDEANGTKLTKLIIGNKDVTNLEVTDISGLKQAIALEYLDIQGMSKITSLDLTSHAYIKTVKAFGSGIDSVTFAKGSPVEVVELPSAVRVLQFEQLPYLTSENLKLEDNSVIVNISIKSCPKISNDFSFVYDWYTNKVAADANCSLVMDNVAWENVSGEQMANIASLGNVLLKGKVTVTELTRQQGDIITEKFGDTVFNESSDFYIDAPSTISITGESSVLEGGTTQVIAEVYPHIEGTMKYSILTGRQGVSINSTTGLITINESGEDTSNIVIRATFTRADNPENLVKDITIQVVKRVYPNNATIYGNANPIIDSNYTWDTTTSGVTGDYKVEWSLSGDIIDYYEIGSSDMQGCVLNMTFMPFGVITGTLNLTIRKNYNNEVVLTTTKTLSALNENVIITSRSNAPIQAALYNAGLVANETHTFKHEAEKITAAQLQTGTSSAKTSIFYSYRETITNFDEFAYFTNVKSVKAYTFGSLSNLESITIPDNITDFGNYAFSECTSLTSIDFPDSVETLRAYLFRRCYNLQNVHIGAGVESIEYRTFAQTGKLGFTVDSENANYIAMDGVLYDDSGTKLVKFAKDVLEQEFVIPNGVTTIDKGAFMFCEDLISVTIPSSVTSIDANAFTRCANLSHIKTLALTAPSVVSTSFGSTAEEYVGVNSAGKNILNIPFGSTGYTTSYWLDPLQNTSKCGFSIYGKLTLASNRSDAQFNVKYTTEANTSKIVTVGVGTCYLNDIKYDTTLTVTPIASGSLVWDNDSVSITYNGETTVTNNAYIYPSSVNISGSSSVIGGNNATFIAEISPIDIDVEVTYTWSISGSSNVSISTTDNNKCVVESLIPSDDESFVISCVVKSIDGKVTVSKNHTVTLQAKPSYILAIYNVTSTTSETQILWDAYVGSSSVSLDNITYMEIDGEEVTPVSSYTFYDIGIHTVKISTTSFNYLFIRNAALIAVDFTECNGIKYVSFDNTFRACSNLADIEWGECKFPNVTNLSSTFMGCGSLSKIDLTPFSDAMITSMQSAFRSTPIVSIDLGPLKNSSPDSLYGLFQDCEYLESIDLTPLKNITFTTAYHLNYCFESCVSLKIIIVPWISAPAADKNTFGTGNNYYTGRNTYSTGINKLIAPSGATGYDSGYWGSVLLSSSKCGFKIVENGIFIQHVNGALYTETEWNDANENANGVAILSDESNFVIAPTYAAKNIRWGSMEHLITDIVTTTNLDEAILDFDGEGNTKKIITQLAGITDSNGITGAPIAEACVAYTFPNGKKGYLASAGQWNFVVNNYATIVNAFSAIGTTFRLSDARASSTQGSINSYWALGTYSSYASLSPPSKFYKYGVAWPVTSI